MALIEENFHSPFPDGEQDGQQEEVAPTAVDPVLLKWARVQAIVTVAQNATDKPSMFRADDADFWS
jgi:hypothetical protein